jgi:hypothetical protein
MLSEDKISHLSHVLLKGLLERKLIELIGDEGAIRKEIRKTITSELHIGEDIDAAVKKKIQSFSRRVTEGSSEWDVLYRKFFKEEEVRRGLSKK